MKDDSSRCSTLSGQKEGSPNLSRTYVVSMCIALSLIICMILLSLGLFLSGMGEGLLVMFPAAFLGAAMLVIHSVVADKKPLLIVAIMIAAVTIAVLVSLSVV